MTQDWGTADRISDCIVTLCNYELEQMRVREDVQPLQLFVGQLLALMATFRTMPAERPADAHILELVVKRILESLIARE